MTTLAHHDLPEAPALAAPRYPAQHWLWGSLFAGVELALLQLSTTVLERLGYTVLSANTAKEALRLADVHNGKIQLLVTDAVMPERNGRALTERLTPANYQPRVLFWSGNRADVKVSPGVSASASLT